MTRIDDIVAANQRFAARFVPRPKPDPTVALVLCMDARINPIRALGLPYGSAHIMRNAGGRVIDALRSIAVSQVVFGTRELAIIHHTECGMATVTDDDIAQLLRQSGREPGDARFFTFQDLEQSLREDVEVYRASSLVRQNVVLRTFIYDVATGRLHETAHPEP